MDVGSLLRRARHECELDQRVAARRAGITQPTLSRWESGAVRPGLDDVDRVLAVYGKQLDLRLVRRHAELHAEFARLAALEVERRWSDHHVLAGLLASRLAAVPGDVVVCGGLAAVSHGVPVERLRGEVLLADDDAALARVIAVLRILCPELVLNGEGFGVDLTVGVFRRHPLAEWSVRGVRMVTRLLAAGDVRPSTVALEVGDGRLVVQAADALQPDAEVRGDVLRAWGSWRAAR